MGDTKEPVGVETSSPSASRVDFFLGRLGSIKMVEIQPLPYELAPDGSIGLSLSKLGELATQAGEDAIIWVKPDLNNEHTLENNRGTENQISLVNGEVVIDYDRYELQVSGVTQHLQRKQFELLRLLAENRGKVLTREEIIRRCWGDWYSSNRIVDVHVRHIREALGEQSWILKTRYRIGYMLDDKKAPPHKAAPNSSL